MGLLAADTQFVVDTDARSSEPNMELHPVDLAPVFEDLNR
jgi:hypothetical protein